MLRDQSLLLPLLARVGIAACLVDAARGTLLESCDTFATWSGRAAEAVVGATCAEVLGQQLEALARAAREGASLRCEQPLPAELYARERDGVLVLLLRDVRRDRELQSQVERSRAMQRFVDSLLEHIPDMIFVKDAKELRFVRFNKAGEELLGYGREALLGKNDYDFFPREQADFFTAKDRAVLAGGKLLEISEEQIQTRARGTRTLHTKKLPLLGEDGQPQYLLGISEDITERKRAEEERDRSRSDVTQLELERDLRERFVSMLTHDLRGPLTAARAAAEILRRDPDRDDLRYRLPNRIIDSLKRAERMVEDLLDASQIRAGQPLSFKREPCDLVKIAGEALEELTVVHGERITLVAPMASLPGVWSAEKLVRVIENLVSNAVKYGEAHGPVTISLEEQPGHAILKVHNLGPPIPKDDQERLFEPFTRTRAASESDKKGWGLGLTLVKGIAAALGGSVCVDSSAEAGTTFIVDLPRAPPVTAPDSR